MASDKNLLKTPFPLNQLLRQAQWAREIRYLLLTVALSLTAALLAFSYIGSGLPRVAVNDHLVSKIEEIKPMDKAMYVGLTREQSWSFIYSLLSEILEKGLEAQPDGFGHGFISENLRVISANLQVHVRYNRSEICDGYPENRPFFAGSQCLELRLDGTEPDDDLKILFPGNGSTFIERKFIYHGFTWFGLGSGTPVAGYASENEGVNQYFVDFITSPNLAQTKTRYYPEDTRTDLNASLEKLKLMDELKAWDQLDPYHAVLELFVFAEGLGELSLHQIIFVRDLFYNGGTGSIAGLIPQILTFNLNRKVRGWKDKMTEGNNWIDNTQAFGEKTSWYRYTYLYQALFALLICYDIARFVSQYFIARQYVNFRKRHNLSQSRSQSMTGARSREALLGEDIGDVVKCFIPSRTDGAVVRSYFIQPFNFIDLVTIFFECAILFVTAADFSTPAYQATPQILSFQYLVALYFLLLLVRTMAFFRNNQGARIYLIIFEKAFTELKDFALYYTVVIIFLSLGVYTIFSATGGNHLFTSLSASLSRTVEFTWGYLDRAEFINNGVGVGTSVAVIFLGFWILVILLSVIAQNILLGIIVDAYNEAKKDSWIVRETQYGGTKSIFGSVITYLFYMAIASTFWTSSRLYQMYRDYKNKRESDRNAVMRDEKKNATYRAIPLWLRVFQQLSPYTSPSFAILEWHLATRPEIGLLLALLESPVSDELDEDTFRLYTADRLRQMLMLLKSSCEKSYLSHDWSSFAFGVHFGPELLVILRRILRMSDVDFLNANDEEYYTSLAVSIALVFGREYAEKRAEDGAEGGSSEDADPVVDVDANEDFFKRPSCEDAFASPRPDGSSGLLSRYVESAAPKELEEPEPEFSEEKRPTSPGKVRFAEV